MRGNQTTQEIPQSSFAMTILPGAAPARTRKVRTPKEKPAAHFAPAPIPEEVTPTALVTPPPQQFTPPPPAQQYTTPPPPAQQYTTPPPPQQYTTPPPPPQYTTPPPPPFTPPAREPFTPPPTSALQFAPLSTADRFEQSAPPIQVEPTVPSWYAPLDAPAPEAAAPDYPPPTGYPMTYPTSPGYPSQPQYDEHPSAFPAAPEVPWVPQHSTPGAYPAAGRSTASKVLIGLAIAVLGLIALSIIAAIAIPIFLSKQKPANRNVVLPATLVDQQRISDPDLAANTTYEVTTMQQHIPGGSETQAAYYGLDGTPTFMVVAGKLARRPTSQDVKAFFSSSGSAADPTLTKMGSGQFGGTLECGPSVVNGKSLTTCASIDNAAAVIVIAANTDPSQLALITRQVISAVEQQG